MLRSWSRAPTTSTPAPQLPLAATQSKKLWTPSLPASAAFTPPLVCYSLWASPLSRLSISPGPVVSPPISANAMVTFISMLTVLLLMLTLNLEFPYFVSISLFIVEFHRRSALSSCFKHDFTNLFIKICHPSINSSTS